MFEFILLAVLIAAAWFWLDSIAKREVAVNIGRDLAGRWQLQLLDETVSCTKITLGRDSRGHAQLQRTYEFEVSASGAERMQCSLQLLGKQLQTWHIPPYAQPNLQPEPVESNVHRIH
jgi:Protein of unknown function (DUF3301)